jgi:hypothetical protein
VRRLFCPALLETTWSLSPQAEKAFTLTTAHLLIDQTRIREYRTR